MCCYRTVGTQIELMKCINHYVVSRCSHGNEKASY